MMPGENGLSVCRWLVARGGPPVILLTAMSDDTDRIVSTAEEFQASGAE